MIGETTIDRYRILSTLGRGAMGTVYSAEDTRLGRRVALKVLTADASEGHEFRMRFIQEARLAASLNHPNLVAVYDAGETEDSVPYIVMELVEGESVRDLLVRRGAFPPAFAASVVRQAAEGLHHAHVKGIVHRDVKPGNLLIARDGTVKVTDFGIARPDVSQMTRAGQLLGTPHYMAPEQVSGGPVDCRADIFSMGVVLYQVLTGEKPFSGETLTAVCYRLVNTDPPPPSAIRPAVPPAFDPVLARALTKDPAARFPDARALAGALRPLEGRPTAGDPGAPNRAEGYTVIQPVAEAASGAESVAGNGGVAEWWMRLSDRSRRIVLASAAGAGLLCALLLVVSLALTGRPRSAPVPPTIDSSQPLAENPSPSGADQETGGSPAAERGNPSPVKGHTSTPAGTASSESPPRQAGPVLPASRRPDGGAAGALAGAPGAETAAELSVVHFVFRHGQPEGFFRILVDGETVYSSTLSAKGAFSKDEVSGTFEVPAGHRAVVAVLGLPEDEGTLEAKEDLDFEEGTQRYLLVKYQKFLGNRELKLYWDTDRARRAASP